MRVPIPKHLAEVATTARCVKKNRLRKLMHKLPCIWIGVCMHLHPLCAVREGCVSAKGLLLFSESLLMVSEGPSAGSASAALSAWGGGGLSKINKKMK